MKKLFLQAVCTFVADNSVIPANIDGAGLENTGQAGGLGQTCLYLESLSIHFSFADFPLWVSI